MKLNEATEENLVYIIENMKDKLKMANVDALDPEAFDLAHYEDILFMYNMVEKRDHFTPSEMSALVEELGSFRK